MPLVPSYIENLENYVPGKPIEEVQRNLGLNQIDKLASNENPIGPSPKALLEIEQSIKQLHRYPDASGYELRTKLSKQFKVKNENVILCERGISVPHTHRSSSRFLLDLQAIPAIKDNSCLPIISDPSHASFWHKWVEPLALGSLAAGAEGLMIEFHPDPRNAAVDPLHGFPGA